MPAAAYREFIRAADLLPQNNDAQIKAATFLMLAGQFEDARTRILPVVDRDPTNVEAQLILGNALAGLKDLDGAVKEIEERDRTRPRARPDLQQPGCAPARPGAEGSGPGPRSRKRSRSTRARSTPGWRWPTSSGPPATRPGRRGVLKRALDVDPKHVLANRALAVFYMGSRRAAEAEPYLKTVAATGIPEAGYQLADYYITTYGD